MDSIQSKLTVGTIVSYLAIFKEPRGFIRLLQFIFSIFAFSTACAGSSAVALNVGNVPDAIYTAWAYPYNLQDTIILSLNGTTQAISDSNNVKPSAQFFVFTGVTSMLLSLAYAILYAIFDRQYRNDERFPIVDFIITTIWAIFWIAGSSAWAQGVTNIRSQTRWEVIAQRSGYCSPVTSCSVSYTGSYADVIVSVIFGYLNFVLWAGAAWFVFKETKFFKKPTVQQDQQGLPNNFSDISSPPMQQHSNYRPTEPMS